MPSPYGQYQLTPTAAGADGQFPDARGIEFQGGMASFEVYGTFGGGTAKLQILGADGATWLDVGTPTTVTANTIVAFYAPRGFIRVNLAGSTTPSLTAWVRQIVGQ